jgi:hypothetical protein
VNDRRQVVGGGKPIAALYGGIGNHYASLIEAAPDMFEALKSIANGEVDPAIWPDLAVRYEKFAAATIAKVKGDA